MKRSSERDYNYRSIEGRRKVFLASRGGILKNATEIKIVEIYPLSRVKFTVLFRCALKIIVNKPA